MTDPDTAALDPIFWLHHANIDRLWETWRLQPNANPATLQFKRRSFRLRNDLGKAVRMKVGEVLDAKNQLDYTYDSLPHAAGAAPAADEGEPVMAARKPSMVGRTAGPVSLSANGARATVPVGAIPGRRGRGAAADDVPATQFHLELSDIVADVNPGVVYGVYVNLPAKPTAKDLEAHRVGLVSLFGVEHSSASRSTAPQKLRYVFDITQHVTGGNTDVHVALLPIEGVPKPAKGAAATPAVQVGTVAVHAS
jgi:tyrosinase